MDETAGDDLLVASLSYLLTQLFEDTPVSTRLFLQGQDLFLSCLGPSPVLTSSVLMDGFIFESELPDLIAQLCYWVCEDRE